MEEQIKNILNEMSDYLNISQLKKLQESLSKHLSQNITNKVNVSNQEYLSLFLNAKQIEGCTPRTIEYYKSTIDKMITIVSTPIRKMTTEEIRDYLVNYQRLNNCSKTTVDNVRRNISSFFS